MPTPRRSPGATARPARPAGDGEAAGARLLVLDGRPTVVADGAPVPAAAYCDYILRGNWKERNEDCARSGVAVFHLTEPHGAHGLGVDFFDNAFWPDDGVYPEDDRAYDYHLDRQATEILALQPQARFLVKFNLSPPLRWNKAHPGDVSTDEDGKAYREATWASPRYLHDLARHARRLVEYCEGRPWADRLLGYMALPYGEGLSVLAIAGKWFDCSEANTTAFRAWLREAYADEAALRAAWGDPAATFAAAAIPRDREWQERRRTAAATIKGEPVVKPGQASNCGNAQRGLFHFVEAADAAREHDYCRFMRANFLRWIGSVIDAVREPVARLGRRRLLSFDIAKQPLMGWPIQSNFDGVGDARDFPNILALSGSFGVEPLLDHPGLDGLWTPADYTARGPGFAWEPEGLADSLALRGKLMSCEDDSRTYVGAGVQDQGAFRDDREVEAGLLRNAAAALARGYQNYWCNVGSSYFHAPGVQRTVRRLAEMHGRLGGLPHRETREAVAMVLDDQGFLCEDLTSGYQALAVIWQRVQGLAHCGLPYRVLLLSDLEREDLPRYRTWLFPNLFRLDGPRLALLRRRVLRDGNVAVFGPATGISDGRHLGTEGAAALFGLPFELHPRSTVRHVAAWDHGHPVSRELPAGLVYGDSLPYGPTLVPAERAVEKAGGAVLGHALLCWFINRAGLFLVERGRGPAGNGRRGARGDGDCGLVWSAVLGRALLCWFINRAGLFLVERGRGPAGNGRRGARGEGDCGLVWSAAMPLPACLLRACARLAGGHIWCEEDDVVSASDTVVSLHSVKGGPRVLRLPRPRVVTDALTGRRVGAGRTDRIRLRVSPPQTRIFTLA